MIYQFNRLLVELLFELFVFRSWHHISREDFRNCIWSFYSLTLFCLIIFLGGPRKRVCRWYSSWIYSSQGMLVHLLPILFLLYLVFSFFATFISSIITALSSNILNSGCGFWNKNSSSKRAGYASVCHVWVFVRFQCYH